MTSHHKPRRIRTLIIAMALATGVPLGAIVLVIPTAAAQTGEAAQINEPVQIGEAVAIERPESAHTAASADVATTVGVSVAGVTIVRGAPVSDEAPAANTNDTNALPYFLIGVAVAAALAALFWQRDHARARSCAAAPTFS